MKHPQRQGSAHPNIAPYGDLLQCRDGQLVLAVGSDAHPRACVAHSTWKDWRQTRPFTPTPCAFNTERLIDTLNAAAKDWAWKDLHRALHEARVPAGAVLNVMDALHQPGIEERYVLEEGGLKRLRTSAIHVGGFQAGTETA